MTSSGGNSSTEESGWMAGSHFGDGNLKKGCRFRINCILFRTHLSLSQEMSTEGLRKLVSWSELFFCSVVSHGILMAMRNKYFNLTPGGRDGARQSSGYVSESSALTRKQQVMCLGEDSPGSGWQRIRSPHGRRSSLGAPAKESSHPLKWCTSRTHVCLHHANSTTRSQSAAQTSSRTI